MINYRVDNLGELLEQLRAGGVAVLALTDLVRAPFTKIPAQGSTR